MDLINEINKNMIKKEVRAFLDTYGLDGLKQAMDNYSNLQQLYLCKTKNTTFKIRICEINYLQICGHLITIYTADNCYQKYGSLKTELESLSQYGFVRCTQNLLVPLTKIRSIAYDRITLLDDTTLPLSKRYSSQVLLSFKIYEKQTFQSK